MIDENKNAVEVFNEMAEVYQQKYMNVDCYQESLEYFLNHLNPTDTILDLACGPGNILHYLSNRKNNLKLSGIDLSEQMIKLAKRNVPNAKFEISDCRDLNHMEGSYNAIVCSFLIPYLLEREIEKLFKAVWNLLVPNGIFYLGFIMEEHNSSEIVQSSKGHNIRMNYYSVDYVTRVLHDNKFIVGHSKSYTSNNINQKQSDYIMIASK
jgi:ubiquinone/menaquinone biosynthesis C-methylase UbiE